MRRAVLTICLLGLVACSSEPTATKPVVTAETCNETSYSYSVGTTEGAAGTAYTNLIFENVSDGVCTLEGVPTAQPLGGESFEPVGPMSKQNEIAGRGEPIVLQPGEKGSVLFAVATAENYPAEECLAVGADGVGVTFSSQLTKFTHNFQMRAFQVCTKITSTFIAGVVPGSDG